jgi:hypothetical protein
VEPEVPLEPELVPLPLPEVEFGPPVVPVPLVPVLPDDAEPVEPALLVPLEEPVRPVEPALVELPVVPPPVLLSQELLLVVPPLVSASGSKSWKTTDRPQPARASAAVNVAALQPLLPLLVACTGQKPFWVMQMPRSGSFTMKEQNWFAGQPPPWLGLQIVLQVPPKSTPPPKHCWPAGHTWGRSLRVPSGLQLVGPLLPPCQQ